MNKKIIVIHHSADFDGLFCREKAATQDQLLDVKPNKKKKGGRK